MPTTLKLTARSCTYFGDSQVFTLQSGEIDAEWRWIEPFLSRVPRYDFELEEVRADLSAGKAQLWGAHDGSQVLGIWLTRIENTPSKRFGVLWIAAGEPLEAGLELYLKHTEPWLKEQGCELVRIEGRKGWGAVLPGYEERARVFVKEFR